MDTFQSKVIIEDLKSLYKSINWNCFKQKTVLITGANGHIATYIIFLFAYANEHGKADIQVIVNSRNKEKLQRLYSQYTSKEWFSMEVCDVTELNPKARSIDYIFHFAGNASPYFIANDPVGILNANITGTFRVCEIAKKYRGCKVIFASSREVYGDNDIAESLTETSFGKIDPLAPRSCYPESKRAAESIIQAYHLQFGIRYDILRIAHCYGPGMKLENDGRVMSDFLNFAKKKQNIILNSTGQALRSFIYITDVIRAILLIARRPESDVWNLSNETEEVKVLDLAKIIAQISGDITVKVEPKHNNQLVYTSYKRIPLDCSKLNNIGWYPEIDLFTGISKTISSF